MKQEQMMDKLELMASLGMAIPNGTRDSDVILALCTLLAYTIDKYPNKQEGLDMVVDMLKTIVQHMETINARH